MLNNSKLINNLYSKEVKVEIYGFASDFSKF